MPVRSGPPRALVHAALEALRSDRGERESCAMRVGFVLMDLAERPWTLREGIRRLKEALGGEYYLEPPVRGLSAGLLEDPDPARAEDVHEVRRLLGEPESLRWRVAPLLGNLFLAAFLFLKGRRHQAWMSLKHRARRAPLVQVAEPFRPLTLEAPKAPLAFHGPAWLRTLLEPEGIRAPDGGPALIAVQGRAGRDALRQYEGRRAVWFLDGEPEAVRPDDVVLTLPPAVQPRLQNPYGWWSEDGDRPRWAGEEHLPGDWRDLQDAARGLVRIPGEGLPAWADAAWAAEAGRFAIARDTLRHHALASRVDEARRALGLPTAHEKPLVSVLLATNRPGHAVSALESVRRQRWPDRELVMVLHGPGFDLAALQAATRTLGVPVTLVPADRRHTLGHCYALGARQCAGRYVAIMDDDNWFGARYLEDAVLWMETSGAMVGGKYTMPVFFEEDRSLHLILRDREFRRMQPSSAQAVFRRELLEVLPWRAAAAAADTWFFEDCLRLGVPMATFDRFNFAYCRGARRHSYEVSQQDLLRTYRALALGRPARPGDVDL